MQVTELYNFLKKYNPGCEHPFLKPDKYVGNPVRIDDTINHEADINLIYKTVIKQPYMKPMRLTQGKCIQKGLYDNVYSYYVDVVYSDNHLLKGVIFYVNIFNTLFVFKWGKLTAKKDSTMTGVKAFRKFKEYCKKNNVDIDSYRISKEEGIKIKQEIEMPLIRQYTHDVAQRTKERFINREIEHVNHLDLCKAYPSHAAAAFPEFERVYNDILKHKDAKMIMDPAIGFMQSKFCNYQFAHIAKAAVNGTKNQILDISANMIEQGFAIINHNTDGIWYKDITGQNRLYHDENEGIGLHKWKHDHIDVTFYAEQPRAYYYIENGKCNVVLSGLSNYDKVKNRENWTPHDFHIAMKGLCWQVWEDGKGFVTYNEDPDIMKEGNKHEKSKVSS